MYSGTIGGQPVAVKAVPLQARGWLGAQRQGQRKGSELLVYATLACWPARRKDPASQSGGGSAPPSHRAPCLHPILMIANRSVARSARRRLRL